MIIYCLVVLTCLQLSDSVNGGQQNTLLSYKVPDNRPLKKSLGYYEDTYLNFTELTSKYGYKSEVHTIETEDGYLLTVFRIVTKCKHVKMFPAILSHGIIDSSDAWILTGPKTGLGYILSNNCYDVWAANFRGNVYSRKHVKLNPDKDPSYWEFSFEENGYYDVPAIIDYVLDLTRRSKVYYIGHSQGTLDYFIMGSLKPEYNKKIQLSVQLAPIAWIKNVRLPIPKVIVKENRSIKNILYYLGYRELFAKQQFIHTILEYLCQRFPKEICGTILSITTGYVRGSITNKNLSVIYGHLLSGVSVKTIVHFGQLINSGNFQRYDEGEVENFKRYGTSNPPGYNVSLVTSPVVLVSTQNDNLSTLEDISILISKLPNLVENYVISDRRWSHNNLVWGINATEYVFDKILSYFEVFNT